MSDPSLSEYQKPYFVILICLTIFVFALLVVAVLNMSTPATQIPQVIPVPDAAAPIRLDLLGTGVKVTDPLDPALDYPAFQISLSADDLQKCITDGKSSLIFNISTVDHLLDGRHLDPAKLNGMVHVGPYPYRSVETDYRYKRFIKGEKITAGTGQVPVQVLLNNQHNTEGWTNNGSASLRIWLAYDGVPIGGYDTIVGFTKDDSGFHKVPWLIEGPMVNRIDSRKPDQVTITFAAGSEAPAELVLSDGRVFSSPARKNHEVVIDQLTPGKEYTYRVVMSDISTPGYRFNAAPPVTDARIVFAAAGDSREGYGGGLNNFMGMNYGTLETISASAFENKARFFVVTGDLVNGYTMVNDDYTTELNAFKQSMGGFWSSRPVYTTIGNHELIFDIYRMQKEKDGNITNVLVKTDKMPYATNSSEALYAAAFTNPLDAPAPSDSRRPTYNESVYTVQYGAVRLIMVNNDYWMTIDKTNTNDPDSKRYGGSPMGYILDDQMQWTESEILKAEADPSVKYVFLFAHCGLFPVFDDAPMWAFGNNNLRAYTNENGTLVPEQSGMIEARNRLALAIGNSSKLAAVINSHEHLYSRMLISDKVPAGIPGTDDVDKNGRLDKNEPMSPLPMKYATWYFVAGSAGGPTYSPGGSTPWAEYWRNQPDPDQGFRLSLQEHYILINTTPDKVSARVVNIYGETIDEIDDLMAVKHE